jgi:cation transport protein ChaC
LRLVRQGVGQSGANPDYVEGTVRHLEDMGIVEGPLHDLMARLEGG